MSAIARLAELRKEKTVKAIDNTKPSGSQFPDNLWIYWDNCADGGAVLECCEEPEEIVKAGITESFGVYKLEKLVTVEMIAVG